MLMLSGLVPLHKCPCETCSHSGIRPARRPAVLDQRSLRFSNLLELSLSRMRCSISECDRADALPCSCEACSQHSSQEGSKCELQFSSSVFVCSVPCRPGGRPDSKTLSPLMLLGCSKRKSGNSGIVGMMVEPIISISISGLGISGDCSGSGCKLELERRSTHLGTSSNKSLSSLLNCSIEVRMSSISILPTLCSRTSLGIVCAWLMYDRA